MEGAYGTYIPLHDMMALRGIGVCVVVTGHHQIKHPHTVRYDGFKTQRNSYSKRLAPTRVG